MMSLLLFSSLTLLLSSSVCEASGVRGATVNIIKDTPKNSADIVRGILFSDPPEQDETNNGRQLTLSSNGRDCPNELNIDVVCKGDCDFASRSLTCESKMFFYHGGPCRNTPDTVAVARTIAANSDSAADCQDHNEGPPMDRGETVYVVITDTQNPNLTTTQETTVGGYFWTDFENIPTGMPGWSDIQNVTFYSSNVTTDYDNMLQTMLFYAPCMTTPLEVLDQDQSVQLVGLAIDPALQTDLELQVVSKTTQSWQLTSASVALNVDPYFQGLPVVGLPNTVFDQTAPLGVPFSVEVGHNHSLSVLAYASALSLDGLSQCTVSTMVHWSIPPLF
ncbi:expressed unknown protein [Seminavis robusta]|uniref:Uncharacterized protein n=1 Tax=Seminavis robusta TaxID=568900 RepID=A0A9N8DB95_9STRA|nr:expressed unknown protein [Seminavis robusta]|eukprot:Sro18_g012810.1 n/a (334) ;mRNA; f:69648-70649